MSAARRVIVAFFVVDLVMWALSFAGVGEKGPPRAYLIGDVVVGAVLYLGLWLRWRVAWWLLTAGTFLGLLDTAWLVGGRHGGNEFVLLIGGIAELALLMAPPLRRALRPLSSIRAARP